MEERVYRYKVKRGKRRRYTYRLLGIGIMLLCLSPFVPFFMGYAKGHGLGLTLCGFITLYGIYLLYYSFSNGMYDISFEFRENDFDIKGRNGVGTHSYGEIAKLDHIVPENENVYSIIHMVVGKESFIIPFSYKKTTCDTIYQFLEEKVIVEELESEV